jgi:EmrB/QacA subfamily drug resistance transporter
MVVMDGAIVNVALPSIQADLGLSAQALQWVVDAYLLMLGGFMLLAARAGDLFGRRRVLLLGLSVFTLASLAGGLARSGALLLAARAVQGLGASVLATSTLAVIVAAHPPGSARARAISIWAAASAIASALGVTIGGVLTAQWGWRWVMFVNVPLGLLLMVLVLSALPASRPAAGRPALDVPGALCITLASGALLFGVSQAAALGWSSALVLGALAAAVGAALAFVRIQRRSAHPLIRLDLFDAPNVWRGNAVVLGLGCGLTAAGYFTSLSLQQVLGYDPLQAGLAMLPMGLALAAAAMVSRALMDAGVRRLPFIGGIVAAAGLAWMSRLSAGAGFVDAVLGPTLTIGLGLGLMLMTATHTALDGMRPADAGLASGLFNAARQLGAALGIASLSTLAHAVAAQGGVLRGYQAAFLATAVAVAMAGVVSLTLSRSPAPVPAG